MNENFSSHNCQLSLADLSAVAAGGDGEIFAGEYPNSGKQVGAMTRKELLNLYKSLGIGYSICDDDANLWFVGALFPNPVKLQTMQIFDELIPLRR
jgi:hypothetical protein